MKWSLIGPPEEAKAYAEATTTPNFYHIFNGERLEYDAWFKSIVEWRGKITGYDPVIHEFLRDDDQLAARMTGVAKVDGAETFFECFFFAKIEKESGKIESLTERAVWGAVGQAPEHGAS
ncbi:Nn.00g012110.m01.CDS01 [Neocucurbitaria sp. VM-36]